MSRFSLPDIVNRIAENNDEKAFDRLMRYFSPGLLSFSHSIVKDRYIAEELVEDAFVKLWEIKKTLPTIKNLSHYLYITVKHASINYLNSKDFNINRRHVVFNDISDDYIFTLQTPESTLISADNLKIISDVIHALPSQCRLIFRLVKEDGLKYNEVAQLLNISPRTVNTQMTRAMARIVDTLQKLFPDFVSKVSEKSQS